MNERLKFVIDKVYKELLALSPEEFTEMLSRHENGDIAKIILETGALDIGKIETDSFAPKAENIYCTFPLLSAPPMGDYLSIRNPLDNLWYDKITLSKESFASNLYELNNDIDVVGWADNLGFLPSDVKSSILCTGKEMNYSFIDIRQPDELIMTTKSENLINVGHIYIGYGSSTVMVNFEEAYSVADNYDWAEAA
jgi:hypothetical protein